jgi:hypothetical protein
MFPPEIAQQIFSQQLPQQQETASEKTRRYQGSFDLIVTDIVKPLSAQKQPADVAASEETAAETVS